MEWILPGRKSTMLLSKEIRLQIHYQPDHKTYAILWTTTENYGRHLWYSRTWNLWRIIPLIFLEVFWNQVILGLRFFRAYLQFTRRSWKTFTQTFKHFSIPSSPSLNINTLFICYLLSTMSIINMFSHYIRMFWNTIHKLICAPSAGYLFLQPKQSFTELYINCAYYGDIIDENSTEKSLFWKRKNFPSNSFVFVIPSEFSTASLIVFINKRTSSCYKQLPTVLNYIKYLRY